MATVTAELVKKPDSFGDFVHVWKWAALTTTNNYGSPIKMPGSADRSVQMVGTLGSGGAVTIYGSNLPSPDLSDDDDWSILTDPQGNNLALSALKIEAILELPLWIRPKVTGGNGSTSLDIYLLMRNPDLT